MRNEVELARWPLAGWGPADLTLIDVLARAQLMARRLGCSIQLCDAPAELASLILLLGLAESIVCRP